MITLQQLVHMRLLIVDIYLQSISLMNLFLLEIMHSISILIIRHLRFLTKLKQLALMLLL